MLVNAVKMRYNASEAERMRFFMKKWALLALCLVCALVFAVPRGLAEEKNAAAIVQGMTRREKVAQLLFMDFRNWMPDPEEAAAKRELNPKYDGEPVVQLNAEIEEMIAAYSFGGVILFGENLGETAASAKLTRALQRAAIRGGGLPLLIGADQEGGGVTRLGQGTCLPGNMAIGATGSAAYAREAGAITGRELVALGIDVNFSPVADVNSNPENPVIGLRSFGSKPEQVAEFAAAMAEGIESAGALAAGKHFPGHGDTSVDSHLGLPRVDKDIAALRKTELIPFQALIDAGIPMIMCAHIQFPALDASTITSKTGEEIVVPATFSRAILTGILRDEMGFDGLIVTDAMDMGAIADNVESADGVVLALAAGADMICMPARVRTPKDAEKIEAIFAAVDRAIDEGVLTEERLDESAARVVGMKLNLGLADRSFDESGDAAAAEHALSVVGCTSHRATERAIAEAAITKTRDGLGALPFAPASGETVLVLTPYANEVASARYGFERLKKERAVRSDVALEAYGYKGKMALDDELTSALERADYIVLLTEMSGAASLAPDHWATALPTAVWASVKDMDKAARFVRAGIGAPYDAVNYVDCPAELMAFGNVGMSDQDAASGVITGKYGPNIPALLGAIFGAFEPTGEMPAD